MTEAEVLALLKNAIKQRLPEGQEICRLALAEELGTFANDAKWIKSNFSRLVETTQKRAYEKYLLAERPAVAGAFREVFTSIIPSYEEKDFFDFFEDYFWVFDRCFLGLTQGRRPRAGNAFEQVIQVLFQVLGYPYTSQAVINGQPDFLLPSVAHYNRNAMDCIIFTVKRTLRERWRQIVTEGTRGFLFFLATIDEDITFRDLEDMQRHRIYLVMPERIRVAAYPAVQNVISFETFFLHHLDPAMQRWRDNGVI